MNSRETLWRIAATLTVLAVLNSIPVLLVFGSQFEHAQPDVIHTFGFHMKAGIVFYCTPLVGWYLEASGVVGFVVMLFWTLHWHLSGKRRHG